MASTPRCCSAAATSAVRRTRRPHRRNPPLKAAASPASLMSEARKWSVASATKPTMSSAALAPRLAHVIPHDVRGQRRLVVPRPINELREALVLVGAVEIFVLVGVLGLGVLRRSATAARGAPPGLARRVRLLLEVEALTGAFDWRSVGASSLAEAPGAGAGASAPDGGHHLALRVRARRSSMRASSGAPLVLSRALVDAGAASEGTSGAPV